MNFFSQNINLNRKFVNILMKKGHFFVVEKMYLNTLFEIKCLKYYKINDPLKILFYFLNSIIPQINLRQKIVAGVAQQVPYLLKKKKSYELIFHWIRKDYKIFGFRKENFHVLLSNELKESLNNRGFLIKKLRNFNDLIILHRTSVRFL